MLTAFLGLVVRLYRLLPTSPTLQLSELRATHLLLWMA